VRVHLLSLDAPVHTDANAAQAGKAWPKALAIGRRALAMLDDAHARRSPVVEFRGDTRPAPQSFVAARDLRDARALLASIPSLPPLLPGRLPHETE